MRKIIYILFKRFFGDNFIFPSDDVPNQSRDNFALVMTSIKFFCRVLKLNFRFSCYWIHLSLINLLLWSLLFVFTFTRNCCLEWIPDLYMQLNHDRDIYVNCENWKSEKSFLKVTAKRSYFCNRLRVK